MSAAQIGANLLGDVQEESLASLLSDLRHSINPYPKAVLCLPVLDEILETIRFTSDPSSTTVLSAGISTEPRHPTFSDDFDDNPSQVVSPGRIPAIIHKPKPITINIACSPSRSLAEVNLLYYLSALAVLPVLQDGNESTVVWLDTRYSFSATRLYQVAFTYLRGKFPATNVSTATAIVRDSMRHVHVLNVSSSRKLLSTLSELPSYLLQSQSVQGDMYQHHSSTRSLSLLILDSATQFHWQDRFDAEMTRLEALTTANIAAESREEVTEPARHPPQYQPPSPSSSAQILAGLKDIQSRFDCAVLYTTNSLSIFNNTTRNRIAESALPQHQPYEQPVMTDVFTSAALLNLSITRLEVSQFAPHMSLEECLRDRAKRQEVVARGAFRVSITPGPSALAGFIGGARRTAGVENAFVMKVTEREGVVIDSG